MKILLHGMEFDPDGKHVRLDLQLDDAPVSSHRVVHEWIGSGFHIVPGAGDDLIGRLQTAATQANLRPSAYAAELVLLVMDSLQKPTTLSFPVLITGTRLQPEKQSIWTRFKAMITPGRPRPLPFPPSNPKL